MPNRVVSFREVDRSKNRPKAKVEFVKPIRNGLRKIKNLIKSRLSRAKQTWREERMELDSRNKSRCNRIMRSKCFKTKEVRKIGQKEAGESRGFSIL